MVDRLLKREEEEMKRNPEQHLWIKGLELELEKWMTMDIGGEEKKVRLHGVIDRIDQRGERVRLLDYKSAGIKAENVSLSLGKATNWQEALMTKLKSRTKSYHLQLLTYALLYNSTYGVTPDEVGIVSFIHTKESPFLFQMEEDVNPREILTDLEEVLRLILEEIYDTNHAFTHNPHSLYCTYCN